MTDYLISDIPVYDDAQNGKITGDIILRNIVPDREDVTCDVEYVVNDNGIIDTYSAEGISLLGGGGGLTFTDVTVVNNTAQQKTITLPFYYENTNSISTTQSVTANASSNGKVVIPAEGYVLANIPTTCTLSGDIERVSGGSQYCKLYEGNITITYS